MARCFYLPMLKWRQPKDRVRLVPRTFEEADQDDERSKIDGEISCQYATVEDVIGPGALQIKAARVEDVAHG
jgi:hypothetical protein